MARTMTIRVNEVTAIKKAGARLMTVSPSRILIAVATSAGSPPAVRVVTVTPGNSMSAASTLPAISRHSPAIRSTPRGHAPNRSARTLIPASSAATGSRRSGFSGSDEQTQSVAVLADQQRAPIGLHQKQGSTRRQAQGFHHDQPAPRSSRERQPRAAQVPVAPDSDRSDYHHGRKRKADADKLVRKARLLFVGDGAGCPALRYILAMSVFGGCARGHREQQGAGDGRRNQRGCHGTPDLPNSTMRTPNVSPTTTSSPRPTSFESM